jgi:hypothetical protein
VHTLPTLQKLQAVYVQLHTSSNQEGAIVLEGNGTRLPRDDDGCMPSKLLELAIMPGPWCLPVEFDIACEKRERMSESEVWKTLFGPLVGLSRGTGDKQSCSKGYYCQTKSAG